MGEGMMMANVVCTGPESGSRTNVFDIKLQL